MPKTKKRTVVTLLLDRSGSMSSIKAETIEGYNAYIAGLQKKKSGIDYTFLQFDSVSVDKVLENVPIKDVPFLTNETFVPRGGTPLLDAVADTILAVDDALARADDKPQVVICIQTDGYENQSHRHTWEEVSELIKAKQTAGWSFSFLGAGIDAYGQASKIGINAANTVSYSTDMGSTRAAFGSLSANTVAYASTGSMNTMNFTAAQKKHSGDKFDPENQKVWK